MAQKTVELLSIFNYISLFLSVTTPFIGFVNGDERCQKKFQEPDRDRFLFEDFYLEQLEKYKNDVRRYITSDSMKNTCTEYAFLGPSVFGLFIYNLITVVNIATKHDMHPVLKLVILCLGTFLYIGYAFMYMEPSRNSKLMKRNSTFNITVGCFYVISALTYIATFILVIIKIRRTGAETETETETD